MVIDPKIEKFSNIIFQHLYYETHSITKPKNYEAPPPLYDYNFLYAVVCRQQMFGWFYKQEASRSYESWKNSVADFYTYLCKLFLDFEDFLNPNIFDKILIICSYIQETALMSHLQNNNIYLEFHSCFARYVDCFFKDEFYAEGGWNALMKHTLKYDAISEYIIDFFRSYKGEYPTKKIFFTGLVTAIKKECHFDFFLILLREYTFKFKSCESICSKCLSYCHLSSNFLEDLMSDNPYNSSTIEIFLQICLYLMTSSEIKDLEKRITDNTNRHHVNCKTETLSTDGSEPKYMNHCLKCFYIYQKEYVTTVNKAIILRMAVSLQIFIRMFIYNRVQYQNHQGNQNLCACCYQTFKQVVKISTNEPNRVENINRLLVEQNRESVIVINPKIRYSSNQDLNLAENNQRNLCAYCYQTFKQVVETSTNKPIRVENVKRSLVEQNRESFMVFNPSICYSSNQDLNVAEKINLNLCSCCYQTFKQVVDISTNEPIRVDNFKPSLVEQNRESVIVINPNIRCSSNQDLNVAGKY